MIPSTICPSANINLHGFTHEPEIPPHTFSFLYFYLDNFFMLSNSLKHYSRVVINYQLRRGSLRVEEAHIDV